jgi:hypothetical protein
MRARSYQTFRGIPYEGTSYSSFALLARHGFLAFCRVFETPGKRAVRHVNSLRLPLRVDVPPK